MEWKCAGMSVRMRPEDRSSPSGIPKLCQTKMFLYCFYAPMNDAAITSEKLLLRLLLKLLWLRLKNVRYGMCEIISVTLKEEPSTISRLVPKSREVFATITC